MWNVLTTVGSSTCSMGAKIPMHDILEQPVPTNQPTWHHTQTDWPDGKPHPNPSEHTYATLLNWQCYVYLDLLKLMLFWTHGPISLQHVTSCHYNLTCKLCHLYTTQINMGVLLTRVATFLNQFGVSFPFAIRVLMAMAIDFAMAASPSYGAPALPPRARSHSHHASAVWQRRRWLAPLFVSELRWFVAGRWWSFDVRVWRWEEKDMGSAGPCHRCGRGGHLARDCKLHTCFRCNG